jgi:hypothetical protein
MNTIESMLDFLEKTPECHYRRSSFLQLFKHIFNRFGDNPISILETGTTRGSTMPVISGGGGSSIVFGKWCELTKSNLVTVDISQQNINDAKNNTIKYRDYIEYVVMDSVTFLKDYDRKIDLLYLDSLDTSPSNHDNRIVDAACRHQLGEIESIIGKLHDKTFILLDDVCDPGFRGGKSQYSIPFILQHGFKVVYHDLISCQVLLSK